MRSPPRIFSTRPTDRQYYEMSEEDWFNIPPGKYIDPVSRLVPDIVSVDMRQDDLRYLLNLDHWHRARSRDPRVRAAWEQYCMMLQLTGDAGRPE
jgi:hypothetical protein